MPTDSLTVDFIGLSLVQPCSDVFGSVIDNHIYF